MQVNVVPLRVIFERKMTMEVPIFQRRYAWTKRQWEPLGEDIAYKFEHYLNNEDKPGHFLGAMVLAQVDTAITHVDKRQIVDGQQRLITMQIFISAYRDFCREQGVLGLADECEKYTRNMGWGTDGEKRFKVYPKEEDRKQFEDIIFAASKDQVEDKHPQVRKKYAKKFEPRPLMIEAYFSFHERISQFFKSSEEVREESMEKKLADCFRAIGQGLQVVTIDLSREDDPQVIFEVLNARGEPLSSADLIRNDIFRRAGSERDELYKRYWRPLEAGVEKDRLAQFMHCYLTSQKGSYVPIKHVYYEYKNWIGGDDSPFDSNVEEELKVLHGSGVSFHDLIEPERDNPFYRIAVFLKAFDVGAVYPFLLAVMERRVDEKTQKGISIIIESYLIRRHICGQDSGGYNRLFWELTRKLRGGFSTDRIADPIADFFRGKEGPSNEWPSDAKFKEAWIAPMDMPASKYLEYILKMLNESYRSSMSEESDRDRKLTREYILPQQWIDRKLTREHILPQQWIDNWPLQSGEKGLSEEEISTITRPDPRVDATEKRNTALRTIGNLTILTQELNAALSNRQWNGEDGKKEKIFKHSDLPINKYFQDIEEWNEEQIAIRSEVLFQEALKLWPRG